MQKNNKTTGEEDLDLDPEDDNEDDENESEGMPHSGETSHEAFKRKQREKKQRTRRRNQTPKESSSGILQGRGDAKNKAIEEQIKLNAKAHKEVQTS